MTEEKRWAQAYLDGLQVRIFLFYLWFIFKTLFRRCNIKYCLELTTDCLKIFRSIRITVRPTYPHTCYGEKKSVRRFYKQSSWKTINVGTHNSQTNSNIHTLLLWRKCNFLSTSFHFFDAKSSYKPNRRNHQNVTIMSGSRISENFSPFGSLEIHMLKKFTEMQFKMM